MPAGRATAAPGRSTAPSGRTTATPPGRKQNVSSTMHPHPTWRPKRANCTPPAIEQFPDPLIGPSARRHGGLIIHLLLAMYTFVGLAIVCDDYFVASLDRICEGKLGRVAVRALRKDDQTKC